MATRRRERLARALSKLGFLGSCLAAMDGVMTSVRRVVTGRPREGDAGKITGWLTSETAAGRKGSRPRWQYERERKKRKSHAAQLFY